MGEPLRLTPTMTSRKLIALDFVKLYIDVWGKSPSYGEVAAELGVGRSRAKALLRQLVVDGELVRAPGSRRGFVLPDSFARALRLLRAAGYVVDGDILRVGAPCTYATLPLLPILDHVPAIGREGGRDDGSDGVG